MDGCWNRIPQEFLSELSTSERLRKAWGANTTSNTSTVGAEDLEPKAINHALPARVVPDARNARMNLVVQKPSNGPPGPIIRTTPTFRHLARPRADEKRESKKVIVNKVELPPAIIEPAPA